MSWFCNTPEAIEQMKICEANNCPDCEKCIWISESYNAMTEYGTVVEKPEKEILTVKEPSKVKTEEYKTPKKFDSFEEKVTYIKQLFRGE